MSQDGISRVSISPGMHTDRPKLAAFLVVGGVFLLSGQDALIKVISSELSLWQFQFFRGALNMTLLALGVRVFLGRRIPPPRRLWVVSLRSLLMVGAMICFFAGVPYLSLAEMSAGLYVFPLFVVTLSCLVLGERVGPRRISAVILGFSGTVLVLQPGTDIFTPIAFLPVGAGFFYACTLLTTRKLCRDESPITLTFGVALVVFIMGAVGLFLLTEFNVEGSTSDWPFLLTGWRPLDLWVYGVIVVCSVLNLITTGSLAKAYQSAESSWLVPFDYSYMVFAALWGFIIWRHIPDLLTFCGILLIAASGIFIAWRQQGENKP